MVEANVARGVATWEGGEVAALPVLEADNALHFWVGWGGALQWALLKERCVGTDRRVDGRVDERGGRAT